jgi:hypothetical protein
MNNSAQRAVFAIAAIAALVPAVAWAEGPFGPIRVGANRSEFHGHCPVEILFTGNINFEMPHPRGFAMNYYWTRSDGAKGPVQVIHPNPDQHMIVVREPWHIGGGNHDLSVTLHVNSGNTHLAEISRTVRVECR